MAGSVQRSSRKGGGGSHSRFYRDLTSPVKIDFSSHPQHSSSSSSAWRHGFGGPDPPPPPILSLEEQVESPPDFSPTGHEFKTPTRQQTPSSISFRLTTPPDSAQGDAGTSSFGGRRLSFRSPGDSKGKAAIVEENECRVLDCTERPEEEEEEKPRGFLALPTPAEIVRPGSKANGIAEEQGWVTIYGITPQNTNLVLREFEKCGTVLKHVLGPEGANWVHVLYQNPYNVQKALQKHGMQISTALMVGVKPMDALHQQAFTEKAKTGFMVLPPRSPGKVAASISATKAPSRPYYLQQPNEKGQRFSGAIASPCKSTMSRIVDLVFGM